MVNFTPVLLDQLEDYADQFATGRFRDPLLRLLARPDLDRLDAAERELVLRRCFKANHHKMIEPYPAYRRLWDFYTLTQQPGAAGESYLSAQYLGDLLTWYHLAWMGETVRRRDQTVPQLLAKAQNFSHADRMQLVELIGRETSAVVPRYTKLAAQGRIELTTSPAFHPIGPLLISFEAARETVPGAPLPQSPHYPGGRTRASAHIDAARESHARRFGLAAAGHVAGRRRRIAGVRGPAGGRRVRMDRQRRRRAGEQPAQEQRADPGTAEFLVPALPAQRRSAPVTCFFRDDRLSDLIGFEYCKWHGKDAAAHFVGELERNPRAGDAAERRSSA